MSQFWQPGSVALFIGPQNCLPSQGIFLGVGELAPETEFLPGWRPIYNDFGGTQKPAELGFAGESAFVSVDLRRWNYGTLDLIANYLNQAASFAAQGLGQGNAQFDRGSYPFGSKGTLLQTENFGLTLFLQNTNMLPQGAPSVFVNQPAGFRFPLTRCVQHSLPRKPLEDASIARVAFECTELFSFSSQGAGGVPNWLLYDQNVTGLPNLN